MDFQLSCSRRKYVQKYSKVNLLLRKMKTWFTREKAQSYNTYSLVVIRYYTFISPNSKKILLSPKLLSIEQWRVSEPKRNSQKIHKHTILSQYATLCEYVMHISILALVYISRKSRQVQLWKLCKFCCISCWGGGQIKQWWSSICAFLPKPLSM